MLSVGHLRSNALVKIGELSNRTHVLPIVLFAPTARCNSRCVSCDWWRADGATDLSLAEIRALAAHLPRFGTRTVILTGGEPLLRPDVMAIADIFRGHGMRLHLLTSGLALERFATEIAERFGEVTVSLDGHTPDLYRRIRGVAGFEVLAAGVKRLRQLAPSILIRARSTIQRQNFRHMGDLIATARDTGIDQISFLSADATSQAFNRTPGLPQVEADSRAGHLLLNSEEVAEFDAVVESVIEVHAADLRGQKIVPGPQGLRRLVQYYRAHLGDGAFPPVACNAPWTSVVIEADGTVRPCFFHAAIGNVRERPLDDILTVALPAFRRTLDIASDRTCERCVCTLKVGWRSKLW